MSTILITGASHGVGRAFALACAASGRFSKIILNGGSDKAALEDTARRVSAAGDLVCVHDVGDVSDIVKTQFGYHLIYKTDHEAPQEASFEEAHDSVRDFLRHAKRGETLAAHVNELRAKADISIS